MPTNSKAWIYLNNNTYNLSLFFFFCTANTASLACSLCHRIGAETSHDTITQVFQFSSLASPRRTNWKRGLPACLPSQPSFLPRATHTSIYSNAIPHECLVAYDHSTRARRPPDRSSVLFNTILSVCLCHHLWITVIVES